MCLSPTAAAVRPQLHDHTPAGPPAAPRGTVSRRSLLAGGAAGLLTALTTQPAWARPHIPGLPPGPPGWPRPGRPYGPPAHRGPRGRVRDLTHTFSTDFPVFVDGEEATRSTHVNIADNGYYLQRWSFYEHTATHLDAPGHFAPGGRLSPDIRPDELLVPAVVVDIAEKAAADPDAEVTIDDLRRFERRHGRIPRRAAVLMHSGWESRAGDTDAYRGTDSDGVYHFPGFDLEAVDWLVTRRDIQGIGVDTLSLDHGPSATFEVHVRLLGADRYGIENLANLATIPPRGAQIFVGLIPWEEGSGGPCRVLATW